MSWVLSRIVVWQIYRAKRILFFSFPVKSLFTIFFCLADHSSIKLTDVIISFRYSYDEGETWHSYKFTKKNERFRVYGILTEPGEKSTVFTIYASYSGSHSWEILEIDMKPILSKSEIERFTHVFLKLFECVFFIRRVFQKDSTFIKVAYNL